MIKEIKVVSNTEFLLLEKTYLRFRKLSLMNDRKMASILLFCTMTKASSKNVHVTCTPQNLIREENTSHFCLTK